MLANRLKQLGTGVVGDVFSDGEGTVSTRTFSVHATLRNVFPIEVSELLDQVKVVEQQRAAWAGGTGVLIVSDWSAAGSGKDFVLSHTHMPQSVLELPANRL